MLLKMVTPPGPRAVQRALALGHRPPRRTDRSRPEVATDVHLKAVKGQWKVKERQRIVKKGSERQ